MKKSTKIAIGGVAVVLGWAAINKLGKASRLADNLYVSATPQEFKFKSFTTAQVEFSTTVENISGFNLNVKDLICKMYLIDKAGNKTETGKSVIIDSLSFRNKEQKNFPLTFDFSILTITSQILKGQVKSIQLVSYYQSLGQTFSYTTEIDYALFVSKAKAFINKFFNLSGAGVSNL